MTEYSKHAQRDEAFELRGGPPANDNCAGAITLAPTTAFTPVVGDVAGATQTIPAIVCATFTGTAEDDVWYKFVATTTNPKIRVVGNQYFDAVVDLRSGACNGVNIACADATLEGEAEQINATGLTIGSTYYIRVYDYYATAPTITSFSVGVYTGALTPPANDQCVSVIAQSLSVGGSLNFNGNNAAATTTNDYLAGSAWDGVIFPSTWHAFTTTTCTNVTISFCGTLDPAFESVWIALNTGCPADDNYILASSNDFTSCGDGNVTMTFINLPADTYFLPVRAEGGWALGQYSILVEATACGAGPANDNCGSVVFAPLAVGGSVNFNGDNTGATATGDAVPGTILAVGGDTTTVWHGFTTTVCTNISVAYCGTTTLPAVYWAVLATSCPANDDLVFFTSGNFTDCVDGNATIIFNNVPPGMYYLPVRGEPASDGPYSIVVSATACAGVPANDECANATGIPVWAPGACPANAQAGTNAGSLVTLDDPACDATTVGYQDVWYSFYSGTNTMITVDLDWGTATDLFVEVLDACAGTSIFCDVINAAPYSVPVDPATNYIVRVFSNNQFGIGGEYMICLSGNISTSIATELAAELLVFPNPSNGVVSVTLPTGFDQVMIELLDVTGRVVHMDRLVAAGQSIVLNHGDRLVAGSYTVRLSGPSGNLEQQVIVE